MILSAHHTITFGSPSWIILSPHPPINHAVPLLILLTHQTIAEANPAALPLPPTTTESMPHASLPSHPASEYSPAAVLHQASWTPAVVGELLLWYSHGDITHHPPPSVLISISGNRSPSIFSQTSRHEWLVPTALENLSQSVLGSQRESLLMSSTLSGVKREDAPIPRGQTKSQKSLLMIKSVLSAKDWFSDLINIWLSSILMKVWSSVVLFNALRLMSDLLSALWANTVIPAFQSKLSTAILTLDPSQASPRVIDQEVSLKNGEVNCWTKYHNPI